MKLLLDTHLLLWAAGAPEKLPTTALAEIENTDNELLFSAASLWEVAIKAARGRDDFVADAGEIRETLEESGFQELPISSLHAVALSRLPAIHADPFDRMLVAQALSEPMALMTTDERLAAYPGAIEVV
ncbi:MAG TPA: type II toxin-antitoxin system VapC family toxin [Usitatibacter sp.]|nr:type II toxin-antitoxin system VapC family toxin [Usitatibacter sp.]